MRHGAAGRRSRNNRGNGGHRGGRGGGGNGNGGAPNRAQVFDSNGPDVRIRGTAYQVCEKYLALAKDAASIGDRIVAESYLQHAEHYQRIINTWQESMPVHVAQHGNTGEQPDVVEEFSRPSSAAQGNGHAAPAEDLGLPVSILGQTPRAGQPISHMEEA